MAVNVQRYATKCPDCGVVLFYTPSKSKSGFCPFCRKFFFASKHEHPNMINEQDIPKCISCYAKRKKVALVPLNGFDYKCPECSTKYNYVQQEPFMSPMPDIIYPFRVSRKLAAKLMATWLMNNDDVPDDALSEFNPKFIDAVYIPVYLYEGKYKARYNVYKDDVSLKNGNLSDDFRIAHQACENTPKVLNDIFCQSLESEVEVKPIKDFDEFDRIPILSFHSDIDTIYDKEVIDKINNNIERVIRARAGIKQDAKGYSIMKDPQIQKIKEYTCYVPFWIVQYRYHGNVYNCAVDGFQGINCGGDIPHKKYNEDEGDKASRNFFISVGIFVIAMIYLLINSISNGFHLAHTLWVMIPVIGILLFFMYKFLPQYFRLKDQKKIKQRELMQFLSEYNLFNVAELALENADHHEDEKNT